MSPSGGAIVNIIYRCKGPATRNDFVNDIVNDRALDAIFATLKAIVDDEKSTISSTISLRVAGPLLMCRPYLVYDLHDQVSPMNM